MTSERSWTVPPGLAVWVADGERVRIGNRSRAAVRTLYLATDLVGTERPTRALYLPPLARALFRDTVAVAPFDVDDEVSRARITLLLHLIDQQPTAPLALLRPVDLRALAIADRLADDPTHSVDRLLRTLGLGRRTVERLFVAETGLTLGRWQRRASILRSLEGLSIGEPVSRVATDAGYSTPSAFVVAFRSELGLSPRAFTRRRLAG